MPVRNGGRYLDAAIRSIRNQTMADFEFIIVDDGSTDDTAAVIAGHAAEDARLRLVPLAGSGIIDALNTSLEAARAPLIARMDADDLAAPERFAVQFGALQTDPGLVLLGSAATIIDGNDRDLGSLAVETDGERLLSALRKTNPILHPTVMMRTSAVRAVGGYRPAFRYAEDYELWIRLTEHGRVRNLPMTLMRLRRHQRQTSQVHRLEQRATAALTRLVHFGAPMAAETWAHADNPILAYLTYRAECSVEVKAEDGHDLSLLLRACNSRNQLPPQLLRKYKSTLTKMSSPSARLKLAGHLMART